MELILIRHGKTEYTEQRKYCGSSDLPLSAAGRAELEASEVKRFLSEHPPELVFSSPMERALETAAIVCPAADGLPLLTLPELREIDFGDFEGRSYEEMKDDPDYIAWLETNCEGPIPNGDFPDRFREDAALGFETVVESAGAEYASRVAVVTHGGVIGAVLEAFTLPKKHWYEWKVPCGGYLVLQTDPAAWASTRVAELKETGGGVTC